MRNKNILAAFSLFYTLVFAGFLSAQEFQATSILSLGQSSQQASALQPQRPAQIRKPSVAGQPPAEIVAEEPPVEALSEFEGYISGKVPLAISTDIRQFGYDLFRQPPSTFAPVENVPVGPDYVFGPGDGVRISVWGKVEGQWDVTVSRDGNIRMPKLGVFGVTGLTFKELKELIFREFSKYYTGFQMNVSITGLRTIRVYMVGNARRPGVYTVSSLSTLLNTLFEAGGPSKTGSLRNIQVKRNGKIITHFDMYELLLKGDKSKDIRLMREDVIFIPPIGPLAAIAGSVQNPAIYEIKDKTTVLQLVEMAGGLNDVAYEGRIQIDRIIDKNRLIVFESTLEELTNNNIELQRGDLVKIFQIVQDRKVIKLVGAVQREGGYGFSPGMTIKDLISMAGGLKYYAYKQEAELTRIHVTSEGPVTEKILINLEQALAEEPGSNLSVQENDYLFVRSIPEWRLHQTVIISGEVKFPGTYTINKGEKLSSLIERAGGYTDRAYLKGSVFLRERVKVLRQESLQEMVSRLEEELLAEGATEMSAALTVAEARIKESEIKQQRGFIEKLRNLKAKGRVSINLDQPEVLKKTSHDIALEEGDSIFVPSDPHSVQVIGSVYNQTAFVYDKDKNYSKYIDLAGGYTDGADEDRVYILKVDGTAVRAQDSVSDDSGWGFGGHVDPGDTIVVPRDIDKIAWMRNTKDITQILFQIAIAAGVLIGL